MTNEPTIEVMNETIARFMGLTPRLVQPPDPALHCIEVWYNNESQSMKYHTSWDWLMPVVDKIESMYDSFHGYFGVHISSNSCCIQGTKFDTRPGKEHYAYFNEVVHETKLRATYAAVYQFITWYNQQTTTNE